MLAQHTQSRLVVVAQAEKNQLQEMTVQIVQFREVD
jgi:hypothetical protein